MTVKIPGGFFLQILLQGNLQVYAGLIGQANHNEHHISQLIGQIQILHVGGIMTGTYAIDIELLHQDKVLSDGLHIHGVPGLRMLHIPG